MGHIGYLKAEYRSYVHRLDKDGAGAPEPETREGWEGWKALLETIASPEEAAFLAKMPVGLSTLEQLTRTYQLPADTLRARLDPLCDRGLVMDIIHPDTGIPFYRLSPPVVGFVEYSLMRRQGDVPSDPTPKAVMARAFHSYFHGGETFREALFGFPTKLGRAVPFEPLGDGPAPMVVAWEDATKIVQEASHLGVGTCMCRHEAEHMGKACGAPTETCMVLNAGAEYLIRRKFAKPITKTRALEILREGRAHGLVRIVDNVQETPAYICNCCGCCCHQLRAISDYGLVGVAPSSLEAKVDRASCSGCQRCAKACPVRAIVMRPASPAAKKKAGLAYPEITGRCVGCGVCVDRCDKKALRMVPRAEPYTVPENHLQQAVEMAIDRGRLAHLCVDEGAGWGPKFLNRVLGTVEALPAARRLLAMQQVRSRFVRMLLKSVTGKSKPKAAASEAQS